VRVYRKNMKIWDIENNFYLYSKKYRLTKAILHYELFKKVVKIPGDVVECGVFKGVSLIRFLTFRDFLKNKKKIYGFDAFGSFPLSSKKRDVNFAINHDKLIGKGFSVKKVYSILKKKKFKNFSLIKGNIEDNLPFFLKKIRNKKISFLHLDLDIYSATKISLETLFPKVSKGGIVLIDDYGKVYGATKATNEFLKKYKNIKIETFKLDNTLKFIIKT